MQCGTIFRHNSAITKRKHLTEKKRVKRVVLGTLWDASGTMAETSCKMEYTQQESKEVKEILLMQHFSKSEDYIHKH